MGRQTAENGGGFIGIRETGGDPNGCDVLITNIKHETLETAIVRELGISYLSKATDVGARVLFVWLMIVSIVRRTGLC